jgi:hypothetical protein
MTVFDELLELIGASMSRFMGSLKRQRVSVRTSEMKRIGRCLPRRWRRSNVQSGLRMRTSSARV